MKKLFAIIMLLLPVTAHSAVVNLDDYAASETSIYDHLNDNIDKLEAALNGGLDGSNFDATFAVGSNQVGANAIGNDQMQDYSIGLLNMQTDAVDSRVILDDTITAGDINSFVNFSDVFPKNTSTYWSYFTGAIYSQAWRATCYGNAAGIDFRNDFAMHRYDSGVAGTCYLYFDDETEYIGIHNVSAPKAQVDINGTLRVQGQAEFEGGVSNPWTAFATNVTTPYVFGGNNFYTKNTGVGTPTLQPIAYTNFLGGLDGQIIKIRVQDIFTTFSSETTTSLWTQDTAADWGALSANELGVIYEFQLKGTNWYCLNRYGPFYQGMGDGGGATPPTFAGASEDWESGGGAGGSGWVEGTPWGYDGPRQSTITTGNAYTGSYAAGIYATGVFYRPLITSSGTATITTHAKIGTGAPVLYIYDSATPTVEASWTELTHYTPSAGYTTNAYTWTMANTTEYLIFKVTGTGAMWLDDITIE